MTKITLSRLKDMSNDEWEDLLKAHKKSQFISTKSGSWKYWLVNPDEDKYYNKRWYCSLDVYQMYMIYNDKVKGKFNKK